MQPISVADLLACPFCKAEPERGFEYTVCCNVKCELCGIHVRHSVWNTVAPPPDSGGVREALEQIRRRALVARGQDSILSKHNALGEIVTSVDAALSRPSHCTERREEIAWDHNSNRQYAPVELLAAEIYERFEYNGAGEKPAWAPGGNVTPSTSAEPVAWRYRHGHGLWHYDDDKPQGPSIHLFEVQPLYASPVSDASREALEEAVNFAKQVAAMDGIRGTPECVKVAEKYQKLFEAALSPSFGKTGGGK